VSSFDVAAQAVIEENREITGTLSPGQHYFFKIIVKKDKSGVRIQVNV